ncbi:MAG: DMT family transporter [Ectothiorhodospiraceae bacterium]|nr:DMT family transporter [Planctomycetota bacterium]MCP5151791.1 DMT family transporter [Chromatiales bacterium]MCP5154323.1 DMT family transporter [Ectothiorhodospiraceae bacterium]
MSGALLSFLSMAIAGRELSAELNPFQIVLLRNSMSLTILVVILSRIGWHLVTTPRLSRHVLRNSVHFAAQCMWLYAVANMPIAEVFAVEFTTPIWVALLAAAFLGERLTRVRMAAIALGFTGVLIILRPGIEIIDIAAFAALGSAIGYATTYVITKDMVGRERPITILFWMNLVQLPLALVPSIPQWVTPSPAMWPWLGVMAVVGLSSHYCISRALSYGDASIVTPLDFLRLPLAAVLAWFLYAEALHPLVFVGAVVIFVGNWINVRRS